MSTIKIYMVITSDNWDRMYVVVKDGNPEILTGSAHNAYMLLKKLGMNVEFLTIRTKTEAKKILGKDIVTRIHNID